VDEAGCGVRIARLFVDLDRVDSTPGAGLLEAERHVHAVPDDPSGVPGLFLGRPPGAGVQDA
jgi:hypothetical protein